MTKARQTIYVGMSGGVDSSVAALLLKRAGHDVVGVFLRCYNIDGCAERDAEDARRVAERIGIPFYVWDFEQEYKDRVVQYMIDEYRVGRTPNPDVMCNREIKFGLFFDQAVRLGADAVATGHYVRKKVWSMENGDFVYALRIAKDTNKDQSYFLWTLTQRELARVMFPIGNYTKPQVRKIAERAGLSTANKKDSQGICFLGDVSIFEFLKSYIPEKPGVVVDEHGAHIGEHQGAHFYTIGQRRGVGAVKHEPGQSRHEPLYVAEKDVHSNTVRLAPEGSELLVKREVHLESLRIVSRKLPPRVFARVRYRQQLVQATLAVQNPKKSAVLTFARPVRFVAEGQSAVLYDARGVLLGGGVITHAH